MRRAAAALVVVAVGAVVAFQGSGPVGVVLWQMVVVMATAIVMWRRWPRLNRSGPSLTAAGAGLIRRPLAHLATLELEVVGATDPALGGDPRLRRRLVALTEHRAGLAAGRLDASNGPSLLGDEAWRVLAATGPLTEDQIELVVTRIEDL